MIGRFINSRAKEKLKVAPSVDQTQRPRTAGDPDPPDHDRTRSGSASTGGTGNGELLARRDETFEGVCQVSCASTSREVADMGDDLNPRLRRSRRSLTSGSSA